MRAALLALLALALALPLAGAIGPEHKTGTVAVVLFSGTPLRESCRGTGTLDIAIAQGAFARVGDATRVVLAFARAFFPTVVNDTLARTANQAFPAAAIVTVDGDCGRGAESYQADPQLGGWAFRDPLAHGFGSLSSDHAYILVFAPDGSEFWEATGDVN